MLISRKAILTECKEALDKNETKHLQSLILKNLWLLDENLIYYTEKPKGDLIDFQINNVDIFDKDEFLESERNYINEELKEIKPHVFFLPNERKVLLILFRNDDIDIRKYYEHLRISSVIIQDCSNQKYKPLLYNSYLVSKDFTRRDLLKYAGTLTACEGYYHDYHNIMDSEGINRSAFAFHEVHSYNNLLKRATKRLDTLIDQ